MKLTKSKEHYIQAIYEENSKKQGARVSDLAEKLEISKASVSRAFSSLEEEGYVYRNDKRHAFLTDKGTEQALLLADRFFIIKGFLRHVLQVKRKVALEDACALEHLLSYETIASMAHTLRIFQGKLRLECSLEECSWPNAKSLFYQKQQ